MANTKIRATAELFLNTKNAKKDAQVFLNDLKGKLQDIETAADKMTVFKDMVAYIAQVDKALAALRANNKDAFAGVADGLDANLKQTMEILLGISNIDIGRLDSIRDRLDDIVRSGKKTGHNDTFKEIARDINNLYRSMGATEDVLNIDQFGGSGKFEEKLKTLTDAVNDFGSSFVGVSDRIASSFGLDGSKNISKFGQNLRDELSKVNAEFDKLSDIRSKLDNISKMKVKINGLDNITTNLDDSVVSAEQLLDMLVELHSKIQNREAYTSDLDYYQDYAKYLEVAKKVKKLGDTDDGMDFLSTRDGNVYDIYLDAADIADDFAKNLKNQMLYALDVVEADVKARIRELRNNAFATLGTGVGIGGNGGTGTSRNNAVEKEISLYDKLNSKLEEYRKLAIEANDDNTSKTRRKELYNMINDLQSEIIALGSLSEDSEDDFYDILDNMGAGDISQQDALNALVNILKIEIPQSAGYAGEQVDVFGKKIINVSEYVSALSGQLKEMFAAAGRRADFEYHIAIDGLDIKARHGSAKSVDIATQTETYLDTLFSESTIYGHSHRGGTAATNISDIESVLSAYRDGVSVPVHFVVGNDAITTIDFTGLSRDMADQLMREIAATNDIKDAPAKIDVINQIAERFTGKKTALQTWNINQFDDLAKYLYDVSSAASSALTPIEKFQAVLDNMFGKGKIDASKYESLLSVLNKDNAKSIFNQIASIENLQPIKTTDMLTMGQVNAEIDESIAKYKTLREEANLSYSDIRNEVDKVIEHYNSGGGASSGLDFFQQYFPEGEWQRVRDLLTNAYENVISIEEVTNRIATEFGVDPDTFAQIPTGRHTSQLTNQEYDDELSDIQRENGALEDKLEILREIADAYGVQITQAKRNRYEELNDKEMESGLTSREADRMAELSDTIDEADANLVEFEETYDRIILKLANGKRIEILPDDDGLRKLYKLSNEYDDGTYNGIDIEDIVFERKQEQAVIDENNQKLREQEQLWENVKTAIKNGIGETVGLDSLAETLELIEREIKEGILTSIEECIARFKEWNNISEEESLTFIGERERIIDEHNYGTYLLGADEVVSQEEADKLRQLSVQQEQLYQNLRSAIKGTLSDIVDVDDMTYAFDTIEKEIEAGLLTTLDQCIEKFKLLTGLDDKRLASIRDDQRVADDWDYYQGNRFVDDGETVVNSEDADRLKELKQAAQEVVNTFNRLADQDNEFMDIQSVAAYEAHLESLRDQLYDLCQQGLITEEVFDGIEAKWNEISHYLTAEKATQNYQDELDELSKNALMQDDIGELRGTLIRREAILDILQDGNYNPTKNQLENEEQINEAIRERIRLLEQAAYVNSDDNADIGRDSANKVVSQDIVESQEVSQLEVLQQKLLEVKAAVDAKTQAFEEEYVTVDGVVEAEIAALQELSNKLDDIVTKVGLVETSLKTIGDNSVQLNVDESEAQLTSLLTSSDITTEIGQLEKLQAQVIKVKNAVISKTKAFVDEGNVVGQVVGKEISGLMKLQKTVDDISVKVNALIVNLGKVGKQSGNVGKSSQPKDEPVKTPEEQFKLDKTNQLAALTKYRKSLEGVSYVTQETRNQLAKMQQDLEGIKTPMGLNDFISDLEKIKKEVALNKSTFETTSFSHLNNARNGLLNAFNGLTLEQRNSHKQELDDAIKQLEQYKLDVQDGRRVELDAIDAVVSALRQKLEAYKEANKEAKNAITSQKTNAKFGDTASINAAAKYNSLKDTATNTYFRNSKEVQTMFADYDAAYKKFIETRDRLRHKEDDITESDEQEFKAAKDACNAYAKSLEKLIQTSTKQHNSRANHGEHMLGADFDFDNIESRKAALADFVKSVYDVDVAATDFKDGWEKVVFAVDNGDGTFTQMTARFTDARNEIVATAGDVKKAQGALANFWDELKGKFKSIGAYLVASFSFHEVVSVIRQGVQYIQEIDLALTELRKVTDATEQQYKQFLQTMSQTASVTGSTVKDLTSSAAD